jgi:antiviral helicase SKI2
MDRIAATNEMAFRVGFTGYSGHLRLEPLPPVERPTPQNSIPDFILPPAFPKETRESIKEFIEEKYLLPRLDDDVFSPEKAERQWEFDWFDKAKIQLEPSLPRSVMVPTWELPFRRRRNKTDQDLEIYEPGSVQVDVSEVTVGGDSGALPRISGPAKDFVKGSLKNRPFKPGGLEDSESLRTFPEGSTNGEWVWEVLNGGPTESTPPSFKEGVDLGNLKAHSYTWKVYEDQGAVKNTSDSAKPDTLSVQFDDLFKRAWEEDVTDVTGNFLSSLPSGIFGLKYFILAATWSL